VATAVTVARPETGEGWLTAPRARRIGWSAFAIGTVLRLIQLWLVSRMGPDSVRFTLDIGPLTFIAAILLGTASGLIGAIIVARRPGNATGWLYVLTGLVQGVVSAGLAYAAVTMATQPTVLATFMAWLNGVVDYSIPFAFAALVLGLFPDGRLVGPRWRILVGLAIVGGLVRALEVGFGESSMVLIAGSANPYRLSGPPGELLAFSSAVGIGSLLVEAAFVLSAVSLGVRYGAASLDGRRQIRWLLLAGFLAVLSTLPLVYGTLVPGALPRGLDPLALMFASLCLAPIATLIAITRYRLYEIDRIVNRAVLYGSLTAILAGVFTAAIGLAQRLFVAMTGTSSDAAIVLTTLVVATLYAPLRKRLEAMIDRRFKYEQSTFGAYRDELQRTISLIDADVAAERLAREVALETGAVGVAVVNAAGLPTATAGTWPLEGATHLAIAGGRGSIVALRVGPRPGGGPVDATRLVLAQELAALAAKAIRPTSAR
jgi:hypothetical protein